MLFPCAEPELHSKYEAMLRKATELFQDQLGDNKRQ